MRTSKLTELTQQKNDFQLQTMSRESMAWLRKKIISLQTGSRLANPITKERGRYVSKFKLGFMYCFYYDPLGKDDLPYYDKFPLTIVLERYGDGFLGLNLHYLPLRYRILFLSKLMNRAVLDANNGIVRLKLTYDMLNAMKRVREFRPCLKRYLFTRIKSRILSIEPEEFDVAAYLPIHQFKGAKPKEIWEDSMKQAKEQQ
jgi:hypothetical protein